MKESLKKYAAEFLGTFVLVFAIKGIAQVPGIAGGISYLLVFGIIVSVGMSLGGHTGYAINPARDLAPRCAHAVLPIAGKRDSGWSYSWIPVAGPIAGAALAAALFLLVF